LSFGPPPAAAAALEVARRLPVSYRQYTDDLRWLRAQRIGCVPQTRQGGVDHRLGCARTLYPWLGNVLFLALVLVYGIWTKHGPVPLWFWACCVELVAVLAATALLTSPAQARARIRLTMYVMSRRFVYSSPSRPSHEPHGRKRCFFSARSSSRWASGRRLRVADAVNRQLGRHRESAENSG